MSERENIIWKTQIIITLVKLLIYIDVNISGQQCLLKEFVWLQSDYRSQSNKETIFQTGYHNDAFVHVKTVSTNQKMS